MNDAAIAVALLTSTAAACLLLDEAEEQERKEKSIRRKCWVKQWRMSRSRDGNCQKLLKELTATDLKDFKNFLRMDEICFNRILSYISKDIEKQNTVCREAIPVREKLAVVLRFLATGESFKDLDYNTKLSSSFLREAAINVCEAIYTNMKGDFLKVNNILIKK